MLVDEWRPQEPGPVSRGKSVLNAGTNRGFDPTLKLRDRERKHHESSISEPLWARAPKVSNGVIASNFYPRQNADSGSLKGKNLASLACKDL